MPKLGMVLISVVKLFRTWFEEGFCIGLDLP